MKFENSSCARVPTARLRQESTVTSLIDYNEFCGVRGEEAPVATDIPAMTVEELKQQLERKKDLFILDVREPHEYQICNLNGHLIPLATYQASARTRLQSRHCCPMPIRRAERQGSRVPSSGGFKKVHNLTGGILAWADKIDPKMPKY